MTVPPFRGVYAIPPTPFHDDGALDVAGLRACVAFCLDSGAHGVVAPVVASEFTALSEGERREVVETVIDVVSGRVPVVVGVSGASTSQAVAYARHARLSGADAVIALPPYVRAASAPEIRDYYVAVAAAAQVPVFLQNYVPPIGTPLPVPFMRELVADVEHIDYIKEETLLAPHVMTSLLDGAGAQLRGVMGGLAGRHLIQEHARGAVGTMPACEFADIHVRVWNLLEAGETAAARALFAKLLPLLLLEQLLGTSFVKEILHRRGIIASTYVRGPGIAALDAYDRAELEAALAALDGEWSVALPHALAAA